MSLRGKQDQIKQLASELDRQPSSSSHPPHPHPPPPPPPSACDVSLQTSLSLSSPEKPVLSSNPTFAPPPVSDTNVAPPSGATGCKGVNNITSERRVKSAGRSRRVKSPVKRAGASGSGEVDISLDNEMRLVGVELTDSYDSSEGVWFSDTNLDGSSVLMSLDEEGGGGRREGAGGGGEGVRGTTGSPQLAWVEGERLPASDAGSEAHGERGRTVGGEEAGSGSRDLIRRSGDLAMGRRGEGCR